MKEADDACLKLRKYMGSISSTNIKTQQKLYNSYMKAVDKLVRITGISYDDAVNQLESKARSRGAITPIAGKDY